MSREESDDDSVATDTTAESEHESDDEFNVEKILFERKDSNGQTEYLVQWEGYPLHRASWEPTENFLGDDSLPTWERTKARIAEGKEEAFDLEDFESAQALAEQAREDRSKRRKAKRQRRAANNDQRRADSATSINKRRTRETEQSPPPTKRKRVYQPVLQRRGVAQKIQRTQSRSAPLSDGSGSDESESQSDDSRDSLFDELTQSAERRRTTRRVTAQTTSPEARSKRPAIVRTTSAAARPEASSGSPTRTSLTSTDKGNAKASAVAIAKDKSKEAPEQRNGASRPTAEPALQNLQSNKPGTSNAARKSALSTGNLKKSLSSTTKKAPNVNIFEKWSEDKTPRQRPRVSGETPKDSDDPKFVNLAQQNRFQKYSRNEKAPDVGSLTWLDPKTGKTVPPTKSAQDAITRVSSFAGDQNPWANERRSNAATARSPEAAANVAKRQLTTPVAPPNAGVLAGLEKGNLKTQMCHDWRAGSCPRTAQECAFAHVRTTCYFWKNGGCIKSDNVCPHEHYDTGVVAAPPLGHSGRNADAAPRTTLPTGESPTAVRRVSSKKDKECFFWHQGHCYRTEEKCDYAHHSTGIVAEPPAGYSVSKKKTCFFWHEGDCKKSSDVCPHAHYDTGVVAPPPPGYGTGRLQMASSTASPSGDNTTNALHASPKLSVFTSTPTQPAAKQIQEALHTSPKLSVVESTPTQPAAKQIKEPLHTSSNMSILASTPTQPAAKQTKVCPDWSRGGEGPLGCRQTSQTCQNLHRLILKKDKECFFWKRGNCMHTEASCEFAHHHTGIVSDPPASFRGLDSGGTPTPVPQSETTFKSASSIAAMKDTTCWWWKQPSGCNKPDDQCKFAHRDTGIYAGPPGSFRHGARSTGHWTGSSIPAPASPPPPPPSLSPPPPPPPEPEPEHDSRRAEASDNAVLIERPFTVRLATGATLLLDCADGHEPTQLKVKLEIADNDALQSFTAQEPVLRVRRMMTTYDFQHFLHADISKVQNFVGGMIVDSTSAKEADAFTELMTRHDSGVIADVEGLDLQLVIWPGRADRWKFLEDSGVVLSSQSTLHFRIFGKLLATNNATKEPTLSQPTVAQPHYMVRLGESFAGLDMERLLHMPEKNKPIRAVFVMYPQTHNSELSILSECFQSAGLKVYHSGIPGAWDYFRVNHARAGLVVFHPEIPWWQIPGLYDLLAQTAVKFFTIHSSRVSRSVEDEIECEKTERLFPHGNVAFITDDVFAYHPQKAINVIQAFLDAHRHKPEGAENNRIVTRPGIKAWLRELVEQNFAEYGRQDDRWARLYDVICKLCPPEDEESSDDETTSPNSNLVSISPDLLPSFEGLWAQSKRAATDFMVDWFAGWAVLSANKYRRFVVCHEPKDEVTKSVTDDSGKTVSQVEVDPRGWAKKGTYQHLGVAPPEKVAFMLNSSLKKKK